jgi:hypothetical protein
MRGVQREKVLYPSKEKYFQIFDDVIKHERRGSNNNLYIRCLRFLFVYAFPLHVPAPLVGT